MTTRLYSASRMVSTLTGLIVQAPTRPSSDENAFAHETGIHQDGVLKKAAETYEIMDPTTIGIPKSTLVLGKHSGRHAFKERVLVHGLQIG